MPKGFPVVQLRGASGCGVLHYRDTAACGKALGVPRTDADVPLVPEPRLQGATAQQELHRHWLCAAGAGRAILGQV